MTQTDLHLRLATREDLPALRELIPLSVRALSREHYTDAQIESGLRYIFGPDTVLIDDGTYFVVDGERGLAAAGGWSRRGFAPSTFTRITPVRAWVGESSKPASRRQRPPASAGWSSPPPCPASRSTAPAGSSSTKPSWRRRRTA